MTDNTAGGGSGKGGGRGNGSSDEGGGRDGGGDGKGSSNEGGGDGKGARRRGWLDNEVVLMLGLPAGDVKWLACRGLKVHLVEGLSEDIYGRNQYIVCTVEVEQIFFIQ